MRDELNRLQNITRGCRPDMHEPDEQDLKAQVIGDHLDNAMGDHISEDAIRGGFQELVVILRRGSEVEAINLATLIALARRADI